MGNALLNRTKQSVGKDAVICAVETRFFLRHMHQMHLLIEIRSNVMTGLV